MKNKQKVDNRSCRLKILLPLAVIFSIAINTYGSEEKTIKSHKQQNYISLKLINKTLKEAFKEIERNSEFLIFYYEGALDSKKKVKIDVKNQTIEGVLNELLKDTENTYRINDKQIYITSKTDLKISNYQQEKQKKISGKVVDENGEPLPGANIIVLNSTKGVSTDVDGSFEMNVYLSDKLVISFLGYQDKIVTIGEKNDFFITLSPQTSEIEEVTVVAFGKQKKASVVASIEAIDPKNLRIPSSNLTTAFAGRLAGVISYQRSGEPGKDNAEFFIRGVTTFGYAQSPLILLDGFEITADDLARIEPDNIEQFSVLKDATAAALYGSKGANGVISVTTKQGVEGAPKVSFRHESRFSIPTQIPQVVDGITYMHLYNQAQYNDNPLLTPYYTSQKIQNTQDNLNPYLFPNINWYEEMFKDYTYNQHYTMNVSGGGKVVRYYMAVSYNKETGILKENKLNNFKNNIDIDYINILAKVNINLTKTTTFEVNMNSVFRNYTGPVTDASTIFSNVMNGNPVEFPKYYPPDEANKLTKHTLFGTNSNNSMVNPYAEMVKGYKDGFDNTITSQFSLNQKLDFITPGLEFRAKASIKTYGTYESKRSYEPYKYTIKSFDELSGKYTLQCLNPNTGSESLGQPTTSRSATSKFYIETGLIYNRQFNDLHDIGAVILYTQEENKNTSGGNTIQLTLPSRNQGIRGRLNYGFDSKYLAEVSLTYNGSEKFDRSHRFGFFPAMGIGYMISEEKFWEPLSKIFPKWKFKYSLGQVGNDNIASAADRFFFLSDISYGGEGYRWGQNFTSNYGEFSINRYANPEITWEIAVKQNAGIEIGLLEKFDIMLEYFTEKRKQIYQARQNLPASMGLTSAIYGNVGKVKSAGIDGSIDLNHSFNKDAWITGRFNFTYAHNKIVENEEPLYKWEYLRKKGWPINQQWGYIAERLFIDEADVQNSPQQELGSAVQAGDIKYKDINGDGRINSDDRVPIGYPTSPELNYGFGLSAGYKEFDISFFFQGQGRTSFFMNPSAIAPFHGNRNALQYIADNHWSPDNPVAQAFWPRLTVADNKNNYQQFSTWWLRDGKLLRLKTLEVGYTFPKSIIRKNIIQNIRIYFSGSNLLCFKKFDLWDPEMGSDGLNYPLQRVYSLGLNVNF